MFAVLFALAVAATASISGVAVMLVRQEARNRAAQRHTRYIFTPARGLLADDDARGAGQNAELLYSVSRLG